MLKERKRSFRAVIISPGDVSFTDHRALQWPGIFSGSKIVTFSAALWMGRMSLSTQQRRRMESAAPAEG
jgi:hypothetical protein